MNSLGVTAASTRKSLFVEQLADEPVLREAWYRVQRGGKTGGVDGISVDAFRLRADERLRDLRAAVLAETYQPSPVLRVSIPKPDGGTRALGVPTVTDRVAQTAAALVLHERVAGQFSDRSFAYRPFLGPRRAALYLRAGVASAAWVVTADIEKFFDNVEHRILGDQLRNLGIDEGGVRLLIRWLLVPVADRGRWYQPVKGLPQGSPVSPVLANLYLTGFDTALEAEGFGHVRYADDFVVFGKDETDAQRALRYLSIYLTSRLHLRLKPAKTQMAPANDGFVFVGFRFTRTTWGIPAESVERFKESAAELLGRRVQEGLQVVARELNYLVRGWRNYYAGNSTEMDSQLAQLDTWRHDQCRACLARAGQDPDAATVWFERILDVATDRAPAGTYGTPGMTESAVASPAPEPPDHWHEPPANMAQDRDRERRTARHVRDACIGQIQRPILSDDGWLRVPTFGGFVTRSRGLVTVRRKKQVIFECPFDDLACLSIEANGAVVSTTVIEECAKRGIAVAFCRTSGKAVARLVPARSPLDRSLARHQLRASAGKAGTALARSLIGTKLSNQRALLLYYSKYQGRPGAVRRALIEAAGMVEQHREELRLLVGVPMRKARQAIFLVEARAAACYWEAFRLMVPARLGFRHRRHRDATDIVNRMLNYGYAHLLSRVWLAVHRAGLEPSLGLVHTGRHRSAGLVFDLMEPFRQPVVDKAVLSLIGRGTRLEFGSTGDLSLRTRRLLSAAVTRRLVSGTADGSNLQTQIHRRVLAFRRALVEGQPYEPYRMAW